MAGQTAVHLILTAAWVILTDEPSVRNAVSGYITGAIILWFYHKARGIERFYLSRVVSALKLFVVLVWEQVKSTIQVAKIVLSPKLDIRPAIVSVPLNVTNEAEIVAVAHMITLTPGTVSVDLSEDQKSLYVHVIDVDDPESEPKSLIESKELFEALVMEVTRR